MSEITELLIGTSRGDPEARQALYARLYPDIKRLARLRLAQSGPHSRAAGLNTTALVHEGFLRMADQQGLQGDTRGQFFAYVGRVLRSVVIDHLRAEGRDKRGGDALLVTLHEASQGLFSPELAQGAQGVAEGVLEGQVDVDSGHGVDSVCGCSWACNWC